MFGAEHLLEHAPEGDRLALEARRGLTHLSPAFLQLDQTVLLRPVRLAGVVDERLQVSDQLVCVGKQVSWLAVAKRMCSIRRSAWVNGQ
jgi:hypothetical protein